MKPALARIVLGLLLPVAAVASPPGPAAANAVARPPAQALTPDELAGGLKAGKWLIVEFGGERCVPCMHMQPVLQELREAVGNKAVIRNFWIQEHPDVARQHKIMVMPTQVVFNPKGEEVLRHMGYFPPREFQAALQRLGIL
ncbi:MAG: thioredoxin family protein [Acidobacteriota bacterium]